MRWSATARPGSARLLVGRARRLRTQRAGVRRQYGGAPYAAVQLERFGVEVIDFCPRFERHGRMYRPQMLVRRVRPLAGTPRICVRLRPSFGYGEFAPAITHGSNHIRYVSADRVLRLTTDAPVSYVLAETSFLLESDVSFVLGADESLSDGTDAMARAFQEATEDHWRRWSRRLAIPAEWQDAVIRAAITLKLCQFEETGAIVAAMTTSIPGGAGERPQLGLPLLLAARRVLRGTRAQLALGRRHDGALPALPRATSSARRPTATCSRSTGSRSSAGSTNARRRRSPVIVAWARCVSATRPSSITSTMSTATWCWRPPSRSSIGVCCARRPSRTSRGSSASASRPGGSTRRRMPACGSCARASVSTPPPRSCAGLPATGSRASPRTAACRSARVSGGTRAAEIREAIEIARVRSRRAAASWKASAATTWRRGCCSWRRWASCRAVTRALPGRWR